MAKSEASPSRFGTFTGVFTPAVLTILGAIMYLREGWVVGNAGLGGALLIIVLAHVITFTTGLAVASIATNLRVGAGGAYAIIAQSLGLEAGGSIGIPLYFARVTSAVLYILAFAEGWEFLYPNHPAWAVSLLCFIVVFLVTYVSTDFATKTQVLILLIVGVSIASIGLGAIPGPSLPESLQKPMLGGVFHEGAVKPITWWGEFEDGDFWTTFSIFFPAVTGIVAGISLSDMLERPRKSIPLGTVTAIGITFLIYVALALWLATIASPAELVEDMLIMIDKAYWKGAVLAGLLGATFSSALGSLVAGPRIALALGAHGVLPFSEHFAATNKRGDPRNAILWTGVLTGLTLIVAVLGGGLNFVAPMITMFFLLTYGMLNLVVLIELRLNMVSFRPTFKVPQIVPFLGLLSCSLVMFVVNPVFSLVSVGLAAGIYWYLLSRDLPGIKEGDVRSGLFLSLANWAAEQMQDLPAAPERNWRPNLLVPVASSNELRGSYRLLRAITRRQGTVYALGIHAPGERPKVEGIQLLARDFQREDIPARSSVLEQRDFRVGLEAAIELMGAAMFRPNILFLRVLPGRDLGELPSLVERTDAQGMGVVLVLPDPVLELGTERQINVWVRSQAPEWALSLRLSNLDLAILLAYQLAWDWEGQITLCMAVKDEETRAQGEEFLSNLISGARLERFAQAFVHVGPFAEAVQAAPQGDLSILGIPGTMDLGSAQGLAKQVSGSVILVRDSGNESVLA